MCKSYEMNLSNELDEIIIQNVQIMKKMYLPDSVSKVFLIFVCPAQLKKNFIYYAFRIYL